MKPGLKLGRCLGCGETYFPHRLICRTCGSAEFGEDTVALGTVEQVTTVRHAAGRAEWQPRFIACVRTDKGHVINAGLPRLLEGGTRVEIFDNEGAPLAAPIGERTTGGPE